MIAALVPVKALAGAKSRLAPGDRDAIERLSLAMMGDVIEALLGVPALDRVAVVTPDPTVAREASALGAQALLREERYDRVGLKEPSAQCVERDLGTRYVGDDHVRGECHVL